MPKNLSAATISRTSSLLSGICKTSSFRIVLARPAVAHFRAVAPNLKARRFCKWLLFPVLFSLSLIALPANAGQTDDAFSVQTKATPAVLPPGGKGSAEIKIKVTKPGVHIAPDTPMKVSLAGKNLIPSKEKLERSDVRTDSDGATFTIPFVAGDQKGSAGIDADLVFFLCTEKLCERQSRKLGAAVMVK